MRAILLNLKLIQTTVMKHSSFSLVINDSVVSLIFELSYFPLIQIKLKMENFDKNRSFCFTI